MTEGVKVLSFKRETLVESLKEALTKRYEELAEIAAKAKEEAAKELEKNQDIKQILVDALERSPQFVIWVAGQITYNYGINFSADLDKARESMEKSWPPLDTSAPPEEDYQVTVLEKLIRVLEKADDQSVDVSVTDPIYQYL